MLVDKGECGETDLRSARGDTPRLGAEAYCPARSNGIKVGEALRSGEGAKRNLPPWQGKVSGVSRPSLEPRPKTEEGAVGKSPARTRSSRGSHGPAIGGPCASCEGGQPYLPFDFVVFLELDFFEPPDDFLLEAFFAMALVPPFLLAEFTGHQISRQRFFSVAFSFFT